MEDQLQQVARILGMPCTYFGKHPVRGTIGGFATSEQQFIRALTNLTRLNYDCFCNINPTRPVAKKAARPDCLSFSRILLDFDPATGEPLVWERIRGAVTDVLGERGILPEMVTAIHTGRGIHCYLHLTPLRLKDDIHRQQVERATSHLLRSLSQSLPSEFPARLDSITSDLARVARCPGTINQKCGRMAHIIQVASRTTPAAFTDWLLEQPVPPSSSPSRVAQVDSQNLWRLLPHLTDTAQQFLCEGAPEGRRHHDAFATARSLREHGVPPGQALEWVSLGGSKSQPSLTEEECRGPVKSAYRA
jgi:hypothetical protein